ncbi:tyrosine-type recombinase/integrase [Arthrobacter sp. H41]|uniref:tyrosine-type recombinase/integrase n=1 Tax=Arthrobacter sp. H41 TaxID=1312978 RepID=UPI00047954FE|nr:tyrosine-type recombinase/integrase [Arthrobacter sp. H41]
MGTRFSAMEVQLSSGRDVWVVVDSAWRVPEPCRVYALWLANAGRAINTQRSYQQKLAVFLSWAADNGVDWRDLSLLDLVRYKLALERAADGVRPRSGKTINVYVIAAVQFLVFCSRHGYADPHLPSRLYQPVVLHPVTDRDGGSHRVPVVSRLLKAREITHHPTALNLADQERLLGHVRRPRDVLLVLLLLHCGLRIGEALGLRLSDVHFLPESTYAGCLERGPHLHIQRRANANGAWAKSPDARTVPVTEQILDAYADYQDERLRLTGTGDYVFLNLYSRNSARTGPLTYSSVHALFRRWEAGTGVCLRPHQLRHTAATRWVRAGGVPIDVVQALLGHRQLESTQVYLHASAEDKRVAVAAVLEQRRTAAHD